MSQTALITGITGQDGAYLAQLLLSKGYCVIGLTRDNQAKNLEKLKYLGIENNVIIKKCDLLDADSLTKIIGELQPDELYNLASQSSVSLSFAQPAYTIQYNTLSTLNLLSAIKEVSPKTKFYQASSSEIYGNVETLPITEKSLIHSVSPYAVSKVAAHLTTINYRETYGLYACCGILFNHTSYLASSNFFIKKVIGEAINIKNGSQKDLKVGNLGVKRDFGYAPDYVNVIWKILQQDVPEEYIIASGQSVYLKDIVNYVFDKLGISRDKIIIDPALFRPNDIKDIYGDNSKAKRNLGWDYSKTIFDVLDLMIEEETARCLIH